MATMSVTTNLGNGTLTTEDAASSHGLPVVVVGGTAYGPAEVGPVNTRPLGEDDVDEAALVEAARNAGYEVYC